MFGPALLACVCAIGLLGLVALGDAARTAARQRREARARRALRRERLAALGGGPGLVREERPAEVALYLPGVTRAR